MKTTLFLALFLLNSLALAGEMRLTGPAAEELYKKLDIQEVEVRDEHGGPVTGYAKYGNFIACEKLEDRYECSFRTQ